jgi:hypothetical protein
MLTIYKSLQYNDISVKEDNIYLILEIMLSEATTETRTGVVV